ncbi:non-ribosomal peptide synthetase [Streptomyces sp. NPDC048665]|uniref:non-ribosomal peptide synthetase n=1 Tax=Streptomyces sp. NPDC048665 TaxID=3155490 RepID=UPI00343E04B1
MIREDVLPTDAGAAREPTPLRARLTGPGITGWATESLPLTDAACRALDRIAGGRAVEELVVVVAAAAVVLAAAEAQDQVSVNVLDPRGPFVCTVDVAAAQSPRDLVLAIDTELRAARAADSAPSEAAFALSVGTERRPAKDVASAALQLTLTGAPGGPRTLTAGFSTSLLEQWWAEVVLRSLSTVLEGFNEPGRSLANIELMALQDRAAVHDQGCGHVQDAHAAGTLLSPFLRQVAENPDAVAVVDGDHEISYGILAQRMDLVAGRLRERGIARGARVATVLGKSADAVAVILGILRAGAAYVPLPADLPKDRIAFILTDAECVLAVTEDPTVLDGTSVPAVPPTELTAPGTVPAAVDEPATDDLAYVIYTSGSTGRPKGVLIRHGAIDSYLAWKRRYHDLGPDTRLLQVPSFAFDSSVSDLFSVLGSGGRLILLSEADRLQTQRVRALVERTRATHITLVPSLYAVLIDALAAPGSLRLVTVAGEATPAELVERHHRLLPGTRLVNEYGPTENSVGATAFDYDDRPQHGFPIGRPIDNTAVYVLDEKGRILPPGFPGEIQLAGHGLAAGYLNRPELTAEVFVTAAQEPGGRRYRTGDRGWWTPNGLEFLGRGDSQVKIHGNRVEIGDVEAGLCALPGVHSAVVLPVTGPDGALTLVGFLTGTVDAGTVRAAARSVLPSSMVPGRMEVLDGLPLTRNGKVDRAALADRAAEELSAPARRQPAPAAAQEPAAAQGAAVESLQNTVSLVFAEVLALAEVGLDDDFFDLGGHSLMAVMLLTELESRTGMQVDLDDFFDEPTVAGVCRAMDSVA